MTEGFEKIEFDLPIKKNEINKLLKQYKKLKKYRKSSLYTIKTLDGTENIISSLLKESEENPM